MRETIHRVLAAEDEARRRVEEARSEAETFLAGCRRQAQRRIEEARLEARAAAAELRAVADRELLAEREDRLRRAKEELDRVVALDEGAAAEAVAALVDWALGRGAP